MRGRLDMPDAVIDTSALLEVLVLGLVPAKRLADQEPSNLYALGE